MKPWILTLALAISSLAWGQAATQPGDQPATQPARHLRFEVAPISEAVAWKGARAPEQIIRPTHAAVVMLLHNLYGTQWAEDSGEDWISRFGAELPGISSRQRAFIRQHIYVTDVTTVGTPENPVQYVVYTFFAVSEEDARQIAARYIAYRDERARHRLDDTRQTLQSCIDTLKEAPIRIEEYAARFKQLDDRVKQLQGKEPYDTLAWSKAVDEREAVLRTLDIERAAQLARLRKIQEYMTQQTRPAAASRSGHSPSSQPNPAILTTLETMLVELNVEMAGTQAKRDLVEKDIAPWREMLELDRQRGLAASHEGTWKNNLKTARENVERLPQVLANPPTDLQPVRIKDDTVRIVPVRAAPETQPAGQSAP